MGQIWEYIKIALMNIKTNKGRSVLTMLGIIIGIASVIMIISIGNGVRSSVNDELENMGGGLIAIYTNENVEGNDVRFTEEDFALIKEKVEHVKGATAQYGYWGATARGRKGADFPTTLNGGNTALQYAIGNEPIVRGRYFSQSECESASMVCVINESSARSLFGTTDVVGMSFEITLWDVSQDVRIVGIRQDTPAGLISAMSGSGYLQVEMPLAAMASGFGLWIGEFSQLYVIAESSEYVTQVAADTITLLENRYNVRGENKIMMESFADYSAQYDQILGMLTLFISFVAAISLLVGGIGVMNIMLVSVTERTREIGLKKAIGAKKSRILWQFLTEAAVLTSMGGVLGVGTGIGLAEIISRVAQTPVAISVPAIIFGVVFSMIIGIIFGLIPSVKAANLNPIDALRHE